MSQYLEGRPKPDYEVGKGFPKGTKSVLRPGK